MRGRISVVSAALAALALMSSPAQGRPFQAQPLSEERYDAPFRPVLERVAVGGGESVQVEIYRPERRPGGPALPRRLPVVLLATAYEAIPLAAQNRKWIDYFTARGYAFAITHVYGTGDSDGCFDFGGPQEIAASARVVAHLGDADWSNGRVGMLGGSYDGVGAFGAASSPDRAATKRLKAIVTLDGIPSLYEHVAAGDGVPLHGQSFVFAGYAGLGVAPVHEVDPARPAGRTRCASEHLEAAEAVDRTGDFGDYWSERDHRIRAGNVRAAVLQYQGTADTTVFSWAALGLFDRLPDDTPRKLVMGRWAHEPAEGYRGDADELALAWFDRYLLGLPTAVEDWPEAQIQDSDGRWRGEDSWPDLEGAPAQLGLAAGGRLGEQPDGGFSAYRETSPGELPNQVTFTTEALEGPLHITGMPLADLWVRLDRPDAHVGVVLDIIDADGRRLPHPDIVGARSARHLEPLTRDIFEQSTPADPPVNEPIRVPVRMVPTDVVAPAGSRLRLTVAGTSSIKGPDGQTPLPLTSAPSRADSRVEVLHDCATPSVLRFHLPAVDAEPLQVPPPEPSPISGLLPAAPPPEPLTGPQDGDGLASRTICGRPAVAPLAVTRGEAG